MTLDFSDPLTLIGLGVAFIVALFFISSFGGGGSAKGPRVPLEQAEDPANPMVFFDILLDGEPAGRVESAPLPRRAPCKPH